MRTTTSVEFSFDELPVGDYELTLDPATHPGMAIKDGTNDEVRFNLWSGHACYLTAFELERRGR
ncbi:MAG: hypothetical protein IT178_05345 [Acidobacteria bacterium]|nr:hypothetical protein [Acidobacteriota bacterium]